MLGKVRPLERKSCTTDRSDMAFTLQMVVTTGTGEDRRHLGDAEVKRDHVGRGEVRS